MCELAFNFRVLKEGITYASLVQLISNPEKFESRLVCVAGFFDLEYEAAILYLHEDDYQNSIDENGMWLDLHGTDGPPADNRLSYEFYQDNVKEYEIIGRPLTFTQDDDKDLKDVLLKKWVNQ